jgi:hypothetical protein
MVKAKKPNWRKRPKAGVAVGQAEWWVSAKTSSGFSYRDRWLEEASPLPFEVWLKAKGVVSATL